MKKTVAVSTILFFLGAVFSGCNIAPSASFTAAPTSGVAPLTVAFTDTSSAGCKEISARAWSFGDGSTSLEQNPSHTYADAGTYAASLTVTTSVGSDTATETITVTTAEVAPTASFIASPASGLGPLSVAFTDTSTAGSSGITAWAWDFGDGLTSTEQDPSHTYEGVGTYTVSLTVTTSVGSDTAASTNYITVTQRVLWYVTPGGAGSGTSWADAFGLIQDAVDAASAAAGEVWVAAGTYTAQAKSRRRTALNPQKNTASAYVVTMAEGVDLYGGFAGTETSREERDWETNATIIDGEGALACVNGSSNAALDGFIIQNGYADDYGAGMLNWGTAPTIAHCTFTGNNAGGGGAMLNYCATPTVTDCQFNLNTADSYGGGVYNASSNTTMTGCTFGENAATYYGGGMYNEASTPTMTGCAFGENTSQTGGGAMFNSGCSPVVTGCTFTGNISENGGAMFNYSDASPDVTGCTFTGNTASMYGGGMYNDDSTPTVTGCAFGGNTSETGGGAMFNGLPPVVAGCTFTGNASDDGGAIFNYSGSLPDVTGCEFSGNTASMYGGALLNHYDSSPAVTNCVFTDNGAGGGGGGAVCDYESSSPTLMNCTFSANTGPFGAAIFNYSSSSSVMTNCILWDDSATQSGNEIYNAEVEGNPSSPIVTYSCVADGYDGTGNTSSDPPLFVDALGGDFRLQADSPCIDTGTSEGAPDTDIEGTERPQGDGYDMGAYEYAGR